MGVFAAIANFINLIIGALTKINNPLSALPSVPSVPDSLNPFVPAETKVGTPVPNTGAKDAPAAPAAPQSASGKTTRKSVTIPENISARFADTGSPAWKNQQGPLGIGHHYGTDFAAPDGAPVFAPYAGTVVALGHYDDSGRFGDYVIMRLLDNAEYYTGHLKNVQVKTGDSVKAGDKIGETNYLNHTHVQLRLSGVLSDFEVYANSH